LFFSVSHILIVRLDSIVVWSASHIDKTQAKQNLGEVYFELHFGNNLSTPVIFLEKYSVDNGFYVC
jgi:hypothetical protein